MVYRHHEHPNRLYPRSLGLGVDRRAGVTGGRVVRETPIRKWY